jgi:hypothetical protein
MLVGDVNVENAGNKMMSRVKNVRKEYTVKKTRKLDQSSGKHQNDNIEFFSIVADFF